MSCHYRNGVDYGVFVFHSIQYGSQSQLEFVLIFFKGMSVLCYILYHLIVIIFYFAQFFTQLFYSKIDLIQAAKSVPKLNQKQLAEKFGISISTVSDILKKKEEYEFIKKSHK